MIRLYVSTVPPTTIEAALSHSTTFFFSSYADPRDLHSFPTRRSSDLHFAQRAGNGLKAILPSVAMQHDVFQHHDRDADRKSTRLNSSHRCISYAVFCLKKKTQMRICNTRGTPVIRGLAPEC